MKCCNETSGVPTFHRMPRLPCCQEPAPAILGAGVLKNDLLCQFSYNLVASLMTNCYGIQEVSSVISVILSVLHNIQCLKSTRSCPVGSNYHDNCGSCGSLGLEVPSSRWLLPRKWRGNFVTSSECLNNWNRNAKYLLHFWHFARLNSKMFRVL